MGGVSQYGEHLQFFRLNYDPGVIDISEPVAWDGACEGGQGSMFHLLHVEVGNYGGDW